MAILIRFVDQEKHLREFIRFKTVFNFVFEMNSS